MGVHFIVYKATLLLKVTSISNSKISEIKALTHVNKFIEAATIEAAYGESYAFFGHMREAGILLPPYLERIDPKSVTIKSPDNRVAPFLRSQLFIALMASIEDYMSQIMKEILVSFPGKITIKALDKQQIIENSNKIQLIEVLATKMIMNILYASPNDYRKEIESIISADRGLLDHYWASYVEMKATRDTGMHGGWKANKVYIEKAGEKARTQEQEKLLPITKEYFEEALLMCEEMVKAIYAHVSNKYKECTYSYVFKEMWDQSSLAQVVPFEDAWVIESDYMVRPKTGFNWGWSHSENMLFDFFQSIYSGEEQMPPITKLYGRLYKDDIEIINSWINTPFFFGDNLL